MVLAHTSSGKLPEPELGDSRDAIGAAVGMSGKTYQKAMCAARLANLPHGGDIYYHPADSSKELLVSQPEAAERFGVSLPSVKRAKHVIDDGPPPWGAWWTRQT